MKKPAPTTLAETETERRPQGQTEPAPTPRRPRMKTGVKAGVAAVYRLRRTDEEQPGNEMPA